MRMMRTIGCLLLLAQASGCATILYPKRVALPEDKRAGIDCDMVILNLLWTGGLGLIVDLIHGTIFRPVEGYRGRGYDPGLFSSRAGPTYPGPGP